MLDLNRLPIRSLMTPIPHVVEPKTPLSTAYAELSARNVHHLPVVSGGRPLGVLRRDTLALLRIHAPERAGSLTAAELVDGPAYCVAPDEPALDVLRGMLARRLDAALVTGDDGLLGIVTSTDIVHALGLEAGDLPARSPEEVRARLLEQHRGIIAFLDRMEDLAGRVARGSREAEFELRAATRRLAALMLAHLRTEEAELLPWLRNADGFGEERVTALLREHDAQRALLARVCASLARAGTAEALTVGVRELSRALRDDIEHEESGFLDEALLSDTLVAVGFGG